MGGQKKLQCDVNKVLKELPYEPNEILKRLIYFKAHSNINRFAESIGVTRQCIWGIISGRLKASPNLAKKISVTLNEDTRVIFPDGSINYPIIKTAYEIESEDFFEDGSNKGENNDAGQ